MLSVDAGILKSGYFLCRHALVTAEAWAMVFQAPSTVFEPTPTLHHILLCLAI